MTAATALVATAQEPGLLPEFDPGVAESCAPVSEYGGGEFFSQELGTLLRIRYNTESYGQEERGNLDIGTMKVWNFDDAVSFFDGQVTLNDESGVGFNAGFGVRWIGWTPLAIEPERITGFSVWADGTHTSSGAFFPQIGLTWESLGDLWDFRANSYIPLGTQDQVGTFVETGQIVFQENFLVSETIADRFTSFNAGELEFARRLGQERDAWVFAGPYALANDNDETAGYRVGLRGYAYPDLMLQFALSDDDIFHTNASFTLIWFVGRTRSDFQPACGLPDRMREPVLRNDYVALAKDQVISGIQLTDSNSEPLRFVHLDSEAPDGGDGTFENPLNDVADSNSNSMDGDILLLYSDSVFAGQGPLVMRDNQRALGEGDDMTFQVTTQQLGVIDIPETSPGAQAGAKPILLNSSGSEAITLADANEVANLAIDGGARGIAAGADGAGNPNLHDLMIMNTSGDGIVTSPFIRVDDNDPDLMTVAGNVTINNVMFDNVGGDEISINSVTTADVDDPDVTLQETILITNVESTNGSGRGIRLRNTHEGRTATILNYMNEDGGLAGGSVLRFEDLGGNVTMNNVDVMNNVGYAFDFLDVTDTSSVSILGMSSYDGGAGAAGGMRFDGFDGTVSVSDTMLTGGTMEGVTIIGDSDGMFTFANTTTFDAIGGTALDVNGFTGLLTMSSEITNNMTGTAISVQNVTMDKASLTFNGNVMHGETGLPSGAVGIFVADNAEGTLLFTGDLTLVTTGANAVTLTNNSDFDMSLNGLLDITTTGGGIGFSATGGGILTALGTMNTIDVEDNTGLEIVGMEISSADVRFQTVNVSNAPNGIVLMDNTGDGEVIIGSGSMAGDGGTLMNFSDQAIIVQNTNARFTGLDISGAENDGSGGTTVDVIHSDGDNMTVVFNDTNVDAQNTTTAGMTATGTGATGAFTMTSTDTDIASVDSTALLFTDLDGTTTFSNLSIHDSWSGVAVVTSDGSFTFNSQTMIESVNAIDFEVDGGAPTVSMAGDIDNTDGAGDQSVNIHDITGGSVVMTGTVTDDNGGIVVDMNSGGVINLAGDYTVNTTGATNAISITGNTGADVSIGDFTVTTEDGTGFLATGGGDLTVNGSNNTIDTTAGTGVGLMMDGINVVGQANFSSVDVDGAANGIMLTDVSGGQVAVGNVTGGQNSGGQLTTTGDAIVLTDVQNVDLRHIRIVDSTGGNGVSVMHTNAESRAMDVTVTDLNLDGANGNGIDVSADNDSDSFSMRLMGNSDLERNVLMDVTGAGQFNLLVEDTTINVATGTADNAFDLQFHDGASDGDVTIRDNNFTADTGQALFVDSFGNTAKDVKFLLENSSFLTVGADPAADVQSRGNTLFQATIQGNSFDATAAANDMQVLSNGTATARIRLNLGGDDAADFNSAVGVGTMLVSENGTSVFSIFERDATITTDTRNADPVDTFPNDAAFQNLATPPALPDFP